MTDDDLRALERSGDALRFARALERVGRKDEALEALRAAPPRKEVLRALAGWPGWGHPAGDAGHTRSLEAGPIRRRPVVRWVTRLDGFDPRDVETGLGDLVSSEAAVVATVTWHERARFVAYQPGSGAISWAHTGALPGALDVRRIPDHPEQIETRAVVSPTIVGDRLLAGREGLDLLTGEVRFEARRDGTWHATSAGPRLLAVNPRERTVSAWRHDADAPEWSRAIDDELGEAVLVAGERAVVLGLDRVHVLGPAGEDVFAVPGHLPALGDARGLVTQLHRNLGMTAFLHDEAGRQSWRAEGFAVALGAACVLIVAVLPDYLEVRDRSTGAVIGKTKAYSLHERGPCLVRDVVYAQERTESIVAWDPRKGHLWRATIEELVPGFGAIVSWAPAHRRVFVLGSSGMLTCLEE